MNQYKSEWEAFKNFIAPLTTFVIGMGLLLIATIFFPSIGEVSDSLGVAIAPTIHNYWGLYWAVHSTRFLLYLGGFLFILVSVGIVWIRSRRNMR